MSAIAGIYHLNDEPINLGHGRSMMKALEKFPADDIQTWHNDKVFLGCHAQWITPESINEQLPYYDYERQLAITADAIIDNRDELFERLQIEPSRWKTITDSELILLSYYKWGEDCPKFLVGDFAFMIWDEKRQKMFGARDFSGSRTLYYYKDNQRFAFCTTIEPLLGLPYTERKLNEEWLAEFLAISGMIDVADSSITPYVNIKQVPPFYSISITKGNITFNRYSDFASIKPLKLKSDNEYVEAFQSVFQKAVTSRLRTYLEVGSQLSGGLDSGSVVGFAVRALENKRKLHTFTYVPQDDFQDFTPKQLMPDERPFVNATVKHVGGIKDHYFAFEGKDSYSDINDFLEIMEMPYKFFENSFWLKGIYEKAHEKRIGVLLNGGRGNLGISWGPALEYYSILLKKFKWFKLLKELNLYSHNAGGARFRRIPELARISFSFIDRFFPLEDSYHYPQVINQEFARGTDIYNKLRNFGINETGWFETANIYELRKKHFEDIFHCFATNTLATKLSLQYSLWERDPSTDLQVIRFCLSVPENQYVQNGLDRALIRRATEKILPDKVRLNQRVRGIQGADWVHRISPYWDSFIEELEQLSKDKRILEFFDEKVILSALSRVKEGLRKNYAFDTNYKLLMRSLIFYRYIKKFA